jgi:hypothetical protein
LSVICTVTARQEAESAYQGSIKKMRLKFRTKIVAILGIVAAAGLAIGLTAVAQTDGTGPYWPQGLVHVCVNQANESDIYYELHSNQTGNCAAGFEQFAFWNDPEGFPINAPSTASTTPADIVTVGYPGALTATEGYIYQDTNTTAPSNVAPPGKDGCLAILDATSSEGFAVSWSISASPTGIVGTGELEIDSATGCIYGTPNVAGPFTLTVTATDTSGASGHQTFPLTVNA